MNQTDNDSLRNDDSVIRFIKEVHGVDMTWEDIVKTHNGEGVFLIPLIELAREYCKLADFAKENGLRLEVTIIKGEEGNE